MEEAVVEVLRGGPIIAYHWDPDSFLAATIAVAYAGGRVHGALRGVPGAGVMEELAVASRGAGGLALLGPRWQPWEVDLLAPMVLAPVGVVDNSWWRGRPHRPNVQWVNPSPRGDPSGHWPSVASLVSSLLGNPHPFLGAVGVVLAAWEAARAVRVFQNMMALAGLDHSRDYGLALECAMTVYGIVAMGDPGVHGAMPESLAEAGEGDPCRALLRDALAATLRAEAVVALEEARGRLVGEAGGTPIVLYEVDGWHLPLLAWREASARGRAVVAVEDRLHGWRGACAWSTRRGDEPLARRVPGLRSRGRPAWGVYQGVVNMACVEDARDPVEAAERLAGAEA